VFCIQCGINVWENPGVQVLRWRETRNSALYCCLTVQCDCGVDAALYTILSPMQRMFVSSYPGTDLQTLLHLPSPTPSVV